MLYHNCNTIVNVRQIKAEGIRRTNSLSNIQICAEKVIQKVLESNGNQVDLNGYLVAFVFSAYDTVFIMSHKKFRQTP